VPKPRQPEGAINNYGEQKVIDNQTGLTRWVNRKRGAALDSGGDPVAFGGRNT